MITAHSPDVMMSFDPDGVCKWADGPLKQFIAHEPDTVVGLSLVELDPEIAEILLPMFADLAEGNGGVRTIEMPSPHDASMTLEAAVRRLGRADQSMGIVVTLRDISSRKAREVALTRQAETDDLTGVLNRSGFRQQMKFALAEAGEPRSLALVDIDYFKKINDCHGHPVGDAVIVEVARRLTAGVRDSDVVGRLGGDEFAILFRCDIELARAACERIAYAISTKPAAPNGRSGIFVSISCGVAEFHPGQTRDELFDAADKALYSVKRSGRNGVLAVA